MANKIVQPNAQKIDPLMTEGISVGEDLTDDIFSGIDENTREKFLSVLVQAKSNLIDLEQEEE